MMKGLMQTTVSFKRISYVFVLTVVVFYLTADRIYLKAIIVNLVTIVIK